MLFAMCMFPSALLHFWLPLPLDSGALRSNAFICIYLPWLLTFWRTGISSRSHLIYASTSALLTYSCSKMKTMGPSMQSWIVSSLLTVHTPTCIVTWFSSSHLLPHLQPWLLLDLIGSVIKMLFVSQTKCLNLLKWKTTCLCFFLNVA